MITCSRLGRFGLANTIFQIVAVVNQAKNAGTDFEFPKWKYSNEIYPQVSNRVIDNSKYELYTEPKFDVLSIIPQKDNLDLNGFFQSEYYGFHNMSYLHDLYFELTKNRGLAIKRSTAVHIRRGDYLTSKRHVNLTLDYYEEAFSIMSDDHYVIYSDDIEFCKTTFKSSKIEFYEDSSDALESLLSMSQHENIIMANSTFSYVAALLRLKKGPTICPRIWFKPESGLTENLLLSGAESGNYFKI